MIAHHDELSLLDKAGSQVDKGRAWRHELQLTLSTSIASCRMNKLTSCHNISKWISGDLDSKCIVPICQRRAECANGPPQCAVNTNGVSENKHTHTKKNTVQSAGLFCCENFCDYMNITFQSHKNNRWMPPQQWATAKWNWEWGQISPCIHPARHRTCV